AARVGAVRDLRRRATREELASVPRAAGAAIPEGPRQTRPSRVSKPRFDPYAMLEALEGHRVSYVLIGGFARVIHGTEELTEGLGPAPALRGEKRRRLTPPLSCLR